MKAGVTDGKGGLGVRDVAMPELTAHPLLLHLAAAGQSAPHTMLLTMTTAIAAGVMLIVVARRLNLPGVVLLLGAGVALGPEGLAWVRPDDLGDGQPVIVSLAVGLIRVVKFYSRFSEAFQKIEAVVF